MSHFPPIVIAIAFAALVVALSSLARRLPIPTPILQVLAGALVVLIPGVEIPELEPDVVFFVFLPPILWSAAYATSLREFKANLRPIGLLAIGMVLATTAVVAIVARALVPDMPWAVAVVLGAIVSPPDAVAATAIVSRLPVPRRVIVVLEGESLVNDASALIIYRTAIVAASGAFSLGESVVRFFIDAGIGTAIGLAVGWLIIRASRWTKDSLAEVVLTLSGPYVAWLAAESLHVSAVLACVAGGLYLRQHMSTAVAPMSRLQITAVWDLVVFLLNAMIFLILGVQIGALIQEKGIDLLLNPVRIGLIIGFVAILVRMIWVPIGSWLPRRLSSELRRRDPLPPWKEIALISWTSMRGIVSLAAALAVPLYLVDGVTEFPHRTDILVITMTVIVMTLLLQGLTLKPIIRRFRFEPEKTHMEEERMARLEALRRGAEALEDQSREPWVDKRDVEWLRNEIRDRLRLHDNHGGNHDGRRRLRMGMISAERRMLVRLRNEGAISDEVLRQLEQELDLEAIRAGAGAER